MASVLPATTLSTVGSSFMPSELSADGIKAGAVRRSAEVNMCPIVLPKVRNSYGWPLERLAAPAAHALLAPWTNEG